MPATVSAKRRLAVPAKMVTRTDSAVANTASYKPRKSDPEIKLVRSLCEPGRTLLETKTEVSEFTIAVLESSRSMIAFEGWSMQARMLARMFDTFGAAVPVEAVALSYTPGVTAMRVLESDPAAARSASRP
jgi:hypothetical protein